MSARPLHRESNRRQRSAYRQAAGSHPAAAIRLAARAHWAPAVGMSSQCRFHTSQHPPHASQLRQGGCFRRPTWCSCEFRLRQRNCTDGRSARSLPIASPRPRNSSLQRQVSRTQTYSWCSDGPHPAQRDYRDDRRAHPRSAQPSRHLPRSNPQEPGCRALRRLTYRSARLYRGYTGDTCLGRWRPGRSREEQ